MSTVPASDTPGPDDPGRVLVVDEDYDTLDVLAETLRAHGHHVALATDGRSGLQRAVEIRAEVVLVDIHVRVLDVRTFVDVLADNPRTAEAQVFVLGAGDPAELATLAHRVERIVKPFHAQEVAARVDEVVRRRRTPPKGPELEGDLQQVALFDLLQVFAANRRTGNLRIESEGRIGEVWIRDGRVVDAVAGLVVGEKALYRILALNKGQFVFFPERTPRRERINASMDYLLMEGVRRTDERKMIERSLPPLSTSVHLTVRPGALEGVRPQTLSAISVALEDARPITELLDAVPAHDLEVLRAAAALHERGALAVYDAVSRIRFCTDDEVPALRAGCASASPSGRRGWRAIRRDWSHRDGDAICARTIRTGGVSGGSGASRGSRRWGVGRFGPAEAWRNRR